MPVCSPPGLTFHASRFTHHVSRRAFSLIEILVTVGLLTFIVLGLLAVFNQTQRAFRTGMAQTDVLEAGRAVSEMVRRELEQAAPSDRPDVRMGNTWYRATNFFVENFPVLPPNLRESVPFSQVLPPPAANPLQDNLRTNVIQRFFFLTKMNQDWIGIGYVVFPDGPNSCVGTLYRHAWTNSPRNGLLMASSNFNYDVNRVIAYNVPRTNFQRVADGVVHLRLQPFAANGFPIVSSVLYSNAFFRTNAFTLKGQSVGLQDYGSVKNAATVANLHYPNNLAGCYFWDDAVPSDLEFELGILEPQTLERYRSIPVPSAQLEYYSNHVAQVHLFRQRISIRNVDTSVYP